MSQYRQHRHLGVYGICIQDARLLLIRKARGPYTGLLDLPGGSIEFGEEPDAALRREFIEETGLTVQEASLPQTASTVVRYVASDGVEEEVHHLGLLYTVVLSPSQPLTPRSMPDGHDSDGAAWIALATLDKTNLTPFARLAF